MNNLPTEYTKALADIYNSTYNGPEREARLSELNKANDLKITLNSLRHKTEEVMLAIDKLKTMLNV